MRKALIIMFLLLTNGYSMAQLQSLIEHDIDDTASLQTCIIRQINTNWNMVLQHRPACDRIKFVNVSRFYSGMADTSGSFTRYNYLDVPSDWYIMDICICEDYAFFCGRTKGSGTHAIFGYLRINISSSPFIPAINVFNCFDVQNISFLDKIVGYRNSISNEFKVVSIGEYQWNEGNYLMSSEMVIECENIISSSSPNIKYTDYNQISKSIHEIVLTDNYLALVGHSSTLDALCIWRCDPDNVLVSTSINNYYYFPAVNDVLSVTHSTRLSDDKIAVSYMKGGSTNPSVYYRCVRTINLSTMTMTHSQCINDGGKNAPIDLAYNECNDEIVMMETNNNAFTSLLLLQAEPTGSYVAKKIFSSFDMIWSNLGTFNNQYCMIAISGKKWWIQDISAPVSNNCIYKYNHQMELSSNIDTHANYSSVLILQDNEFPTPFPRIMVKNKHTINDCYSL